MNVVLQNLREQDDICVEIITPPSDDGNDAILTFMVSMENGATKVKTKNIRLSMGTKTECCPMEDWREEDVSGIHKVKATIKVDGETAESESNLIDFGE